MHHGLNNSATKEGETCGKAGETCGETCGNNFVVKNFIKNKKKTTVKILAEARKFSCEAPISTCFYEQRNYVSLVDLYQVGTVCR